MAATPSNNLIWHGKMLIAIWAAVTIKIMPLCFDDDATWNLAYDAMPPYHFRSLSVVLALYALSLII